MWYTYPFRWGLPCQKVTSPLVYSEDLSVAQQVAHLFGIFQQVYEVIDGYVTKDDFDGFLLWLAGEQQAQTEQLQAYARAQDALLRADLLEMIQQLTAGALQWDVTLGDYRPSKQAQRHMLDFVSVHAMTVGEFEAWAVANESTCQKLAESGLTAQGWAVYAGPVLVGPDYVSPRLYSKPQA